MSQTDDILNELRHQGEAGITPLQGLQWFGCFRLAARIADAKARLDEDEYIVNVGATVNGKSVARYVLRIVEPSQPGLGL